MRPRTTIGQVCARIAWDRQNRFRTFPGDGREVSGGESGRRNQGQAKQSIEVAVNPDLVESWRHPVGGAKPMSSSVEVQSLPAQASPDQAEFTSLLKDKRFDEMAERSGRMQG